jgi:stage IV sporulation protein FB
MLLAEPQETAADLRFEIAGIRVRVSVFFWVAAVLLGWGACQWWAGNDQRALLQYLALWVGAVFVSILVHELGHALAYRAFGQGAHVVLYHFGGLAVPEAWGRRAHLRPFQRLVVAAAGPAAQLVLAAVIVFCLRAAGRVVPFPFVGLGERLGLFAGERFDSAFAAATFEFLLSINLFWPLVNLVPVPPLDGGQIVREGLLTLGVGDAHRIAGIVGVAAGAAAAWWGYTRGQPYLGILFAMLAVSCWQNLSGGSSTWRR